MLAKDINTFSKIVHQAFPHTISALIVFVGDGYTRLDFYHLGKRGRILEIPFGTEHMLKRIAEGMNVPTAIAESYLALMGTDSLDFKIKHKLEEIQAVCEIEFKNLWNKAEYFKIDSPYDVFVHVDSPFEESFRTIIEQICPSNRISVLGPNNELTHLLRTESSQVKGFNIQ
jgi:hypothetical protein